MSTIAQNVLTTDDLLRRIKNEGVESRVEVNQRALVNKLLTRYSSRFAVFRELIQNSDDAHAKTFRLQITCDTKLKRRILKQPAYDQDYSNSISADKSSPSEAVFHNSVITEIRAVNNGLVFTEVDWKRVATIAEGNTNIDAVGQFGVGFFTVFSYSETPMIKSGNEYMAFVWHDKKSLKTFRSILPNDEHSSLTTVVLKMENTHILQTKSTTDIDLLSTDENQNNENRSNGTTEIPTINLNQLKAYFIQVLSFTKYLEEVAIEINGLTIFQVNKTKKTLPSSPTTLSFQKSSLCMNNKYMFHLKTSVHVEQTFTIASGPSITMNYVDMEFVVYIEQKCRDKIEQSIQKSLPSTIHIQFLYPCIDSLNNKQTFESTDSELNTHLLHSSIPLKFSDGEILPNGHIFIGLATHQLTGIGIHLYSHLIPTIERVNLDLQSPYIKEWNKEILRSAGKSTRLIYDQMIQTSLENYDIILSLYSFQSTGSETEIGSLIVDGFFSLKKAILVPVKRTTTDAQLSLIASTEAFINDSQYFSSFLSIPLVPYEFGTKTFFSILEQRQMIRRVSKETILDHLQNRILLSTELIALLNWLCSNQSSDREYTKQFLHNIRYCETTESTIVTLQQLDSYNLSSIFSCLPLPSNVLPTNIASHFLPKQLKNKLLLTEVSIDQLMLFYLQEDQRKLFCNINNSPHLLSFISQCLNRLHVSVWSEIKNVLSSLPCIPTTKGMQLPKDSYIRSPTVSSELPIITLNILRHLEQDESENTSKSNETSSATDQLINPVSIELLKSIGCRTIQIQGSSNQNDKLSDESVDNQKYIQDLLKDKKNMSAADIAALKQSKWLFGTNLDATTNKKTKYIPNDLCFPAVAEKLNWPRLLIVDWPDKEIQKEDYAFLKQLGVREAPDLSTLIDRMIEEHNEKKRQHLNITMAEYEISYALRFFVTNFQYYRNQWDSDISQPAFLPGYRLETPFDEQNDVNSSKIELFAPNSVYTDKNPLFPILIPEVVELFKVHGNISSIGVNRRPTLLVAFKSIMNRKNEILTIQSAPQLFFYLSTLNGLNDAANCIKESACIPLPNDDFFVKPTHVFFQMNNFLADNMDTSGLIDFIDYGEPANSFLRNVGVAEYPSPAAIAELLLDRQAKYFSRVKDGNNDLLTKRLGVYEKCLTKLAECSFKNELNRYSLRTRLQNEPWCLGYQTIVTKDNTKNTTFKIVVPNKIYLNDDQQMQDEFEPLSAPNLIDINKLYEYFGSKWLSASVRQKLIHTGKTKDTKCSIQLQELLHTRFNMLFVNNREETVEDANERRIEILQNHLSVYATSKIECQLTLENKIIILKSDKCGTCALECTNNKAELYIRNDVSEIEYFDVATELVRFVMKSQDEALIPLISIKLSSSLGTLRRQGIPVDRLLRTVIKPPQAVTKQHDGDKNTAERNEQLPTKITEPEKTQKGSKKDSQIATKETNETDITSKETKTYVSHSRNPNFGHNKKQYIESISTIIRSGNEYKKSKMKNEEYIKKETNVSCETIPAMDLRRYNQLFHSIPLYVEKQVTITAKMIDQAKQLAYLLNRLATHIFQVSIGTIHIFRDIDSNRIAFNKENALFFNLRYYEQVFADDVNPLTAKSFDPILSRLINFYFLVMCHELTHNQHKEHSIEFMNTMMSIAVEYMPRKEVFHSQFSFGKYA